MSVSKSDNDHRNNAHRTEPNFGKLDDIMAAVGDHTLRPSRPTPKLAPQRRYRQRITILAVLALFAMGTALAWRYQDQLRVFLPNTELNDTLARAQEALAQGQLIGTQGDSARELFQSARNVDPDNEGARIGLIQVGEKLLERARVALQRNDFTEVRHSLDAARELLGGGQAIEELEQNLQRAESRNTEIESELVKAQTALDAGRILGNDGAAAHYRRVLAADHDHALAQTGLSKSADVLADKARNALHTGDGNAAARYIEEVASLMPSYAVLAELRGELAQQRQAAQAVIAAKLQKLLKNGEAALRAGQIAGGENSALALFQAALKQDSRNARARAGLREVAQALIVQANAAIDGNNVALADKLLAQAETLAANVPELRAAKTNLRELHERLDIEASRPTLTPAQHKQLKKLLAEAAQAAATGNIILPPGVSAFDKYRAALHIDGKNVPAQEALKRLPARARELFQKAIRDNLPNQARSMLDAIYQLAPGDTDIAVMQEQLANAYLDQAEICIIQNRRAEAIHALSAARELSPRSSRLAVIETRISSL